MVFAFRDPRHRGIRRARLLSLVPVLLTAHNLEEALTIGSILPLASARLAGVLGSLLPAVTHAQFLVALAAMTIIPYLLAAFGDLNRSGNQAGYALLAVQATMLVNVGWHVAASVALGGYAPGVATAVLLNLPFSLYLLHRAWERRWYSRAALLALAPLALALHGPALLGFLSLVVL